MVHPDCCEDAKKISLRYGNFPLTSKTCFMDNKPLWYAMFNSDEQCPESPRSAFIKFCPFCGKALPDIRLKKKLPKKVTTVEDEGYYCSTCHERLMRCKCTSPIEMWCLNKG